jgi:uncharacterized protein
VDSPLIQLVLILIIAYLFSLWLSDLRAAQAGNIKPDAFPGAMNCPGRLVVVGIAGAVLLLAGETIGESMLNVSSEQSSMTLLFALVTLASGFGEELVFRGYLVITNRGKTMLWLGIFFFSILFSLAHQHLWTWEDGFLSFHWTTKALFSTGVVFLNSLWFYFLRFNKDNSNRSLLPCIAAHVASNAGVFFVKLAQGHVSGVY